MLAKDIVASRLESGIPLQNSHTKFFNQLTFTHCIKHNIQLQIGGADQWGNITAGLDLIRKKKKDQKPVSSLTIPFNAKSRWYKIWENSGWRYLVRS